MPRPRKTKQPEVQKDETPIEEKSVENKVQYIYRPDGKIDWRKMIPNEHIALNRFNYATRNIDVDSLTEEQKQKYIQEAREEDLVIKLAGFREIARLRGFKYISPSILHFSPDHVVVRCCIVWLPNEENPMGLEVSAIASASKYSVDDRYLKYLETIAENRAFVRAVRHSLGIVAVGQDEIKQDDEKVEVRNTKIHSLLNELLSKAGLDMDSLQILCAKEGIPWDEKWDKVEKIDPATVITVVPLIKNLIKS